MTLKAICVCCLIFLYIIEFYSILLQSLLNICQIHRLCYLNDNILLKLGYSTDKMAQKINDLKIGLGTYGVSFIVTAYLATNCKNYIYILVER